MSKPSIPKGTRDFSPNIMAKRKFILSTIENVYQTFGFMPLETPAMENLTTLTGKYGNEGDQLLFKILNSGDFLNDIDLSQYDSKKLTPYISEKGLRYDLTVPLARFVVMNQHLINFPFKRYQMQPVWRADRPQKNRYREFWQCDADVLGTSSLLCEADFIAIYHQVFSKLQINEYEIRINHRKLLEATIEKANASQYFKEITVIIDKLDKIGPDGVRNELSQLGIFDTDINTIFSLLNKKVFNQQTIQDIEKSFQNSELANQALADLNNILSLVGDKPQNVFFDGSLARGLDYYTGCIFEVVPTSIKMGSISGGGRYDNLTGMFGLNGISGVGISFGIDRLYDLMEELQLFPEQQTHFTDLLFCPLDEAGISYCMPLANDLRKQGIKTEIYPQASKIKKQLDYANQKQIKWAAIVGENELKNNQIMLKNLLVGEQALINKMDILNFINI
ncbi:MAG: histidine--tRNA ligase [Bacteroidota bacterium]|nr:histidine--tRNA ligase [Bacteroidota bacterium]